MANERLDVIIFGATGFTGKYVVKHAARLCKVKDLKFGVSGRRKEALETVVKEFADGTDVPIILADLKDEESLKNMTQQCKVVINCCGPYRFYGEPVIKACISTKTHYVDVSGEPQFMERMQLEYNKAAQEAGVYVVSACGFDSIPCDLGIIFTKQKFEGEVNSVETYLQCQTTANFGGPVLHYGTWESAIYGLAHANELRTIRTQLFPTKLPKLQPTLKKRGQIHKSPINGGWSVVFPGSDRAVAYRTQRFLYENNKERPVQIQTYMTFNSMGAVLKTAIIGLIFTLLTKFGYGRTLLLKYPSFFSGGFVTREALKEKAMDALKFSITIRAVGWSEKLAEPTDKHVKPPNKTMITKVSGSNPGYGATCICVVLSAITVVTESDKMPDSGGVLPPGAAFGKTSLIEELNKNGLTFEVVSTEH